MNVIRSCDKNETLMFICAFWNNWINSTSIPQILAHFVTKSLDQVLFSDIIMEVSNIHVFNLPFPVYAFVVILLVVALLYCVVVFAYDCCDAAVVYHPVNGDRLWYSRLLSGLSCIIIGGEYVDDVVLEIQPDYCCSHFILSGSRFVISDLFFGILIFMRTGWLSFKDLIISSFSSGCFCRLFIFSCNHILFFMCCMLESILKHSTDSSRV